jgi:WD40 repeat protein
MAVGKGQTFKLSVQLEGHSADVSVFLDFYRQHVLIVALQVRSVSSTFLNDKNAPLLLSGSRDGTAKVWGRAQGSKSKRDLGLWYTLEGQSGFVNCTAWMRQGSEGKAA